MSSVVTHEGLVAAPIPEKPIINDFSLQIATANGSGSQSSNTILMRTIHQMGIPVSGKNLFPSNIQGLPTWFTIRASKQGYIARRRDVQVLVCMNSETAQEDVRTVAPGAAVVHEESLKLDAIRSDLVFYPVPFSKLVLELCSDGKLRRLVVNMIYVGVLGWLLGLDPNEIAEATRKQFKGKAKAVDLNIGAIFGGWKWAAENLAKRDPFWLERMDKTRGQIIIDGNAAAAIGCMFAGVTCVTRYPIALLVARRVAIDYMRDHRIDPETGKATFAIVQAEDDSRPSAWCSGPPGGCPRDDGDVRAGHLAHGEFRDSGTTPRSPRSSSTSSASDPRRGSPPGRCRGTSSRRTTSRTATRATSCCSPAR
jgi:2-oxoglutarate ferredoxin oxidoreductase subunit alpha